MRGTRDWTAIHATWRDDERMQALGSDHAARSFFLLLLLQVDEHGRACGSPAFLRSRVWPLMASLEETIAAIDACVRVRLVELYEANGKTYLHVPDWEEHAGSHGKRSHRHNSEFPAPPAQGVLQLMPCVSAPRTEAPAKVELQPTCRSVSGSTRPVRPERPDRPVLARARARLNSDSVLKSSSSTPEGKSLCIPVALAGELSPPANTRPLKVSDARAAISTARKSLIAHWNQRWSIERHEKFLWTNAHKQTLYGLLPLVQQTQALGLRSAVAFVQQRITLALGDRDHFVRKRMSPGFLRSQWARWSDDAPGSAAAAARLEARVEQKLERRAHQ